ncbi:MAG: hypothetical protein ACOCV8_03285 [Spirochaetota bacterium]
MRQHYATVELSHNSNIYSKAYSNIKKEFKHPRLFEPLRLRFNASKKFIAIDPIYAWFESFEVPPLKEKLFQLPEYLLEVCFEFGIEVMSINRKETIEKRVSFRQKRIIIEMEKFNDIYPAGCYEPGARLVTVYNKHLKNELYNIPAYFMAKAFQHAVLSNPNLLKMPEYKISAQNRFLPYYVIRYALRKGIEYFAYSLEKFISKERWAELKNDDRPMFRLLEMLFGKHHSTIKEEELTGMEYSYSPDIY